jgi:secreted trypsin-like serine protease
MLLRYKRDSGSPLVAFNVFDELRVVGLVSFGKDCGLGGFPGVYTELAYFLEWINDNVQ